MKAFVSQCVPVTWDILPQTHYTFLVMNVIMWVSLLVANQKDPGFLARNTEEYHRLDSLSVSSIYE